MQKVITLLVAALLLADVASAYGGPGVGTSFLISYSGHGGAISRDIKETGDYKAYGVYKIERDRPVRLKIGVLGIESLDITTMNDIYRANFLIAKARSDNIQKLDGDVLLHFAILTDIDNSDLKKAKIKFKVNASLVDDVRDIALYHLIDDKWVEERTYYNRRQGKYIIYSAVISGFSEFAVVNKRKHKTEKAEPIPTPINTPVQENKVEEKKVETPEPAETSAKPETKVKKQIPVPATPTPLPTDREKAETETISPYIQGFIVMAFALSVATLIVILICLAFMLEGAGKNGKHDIEEDEEVKRKDE